MEICENGRLGPAESPFLPVSRIYLPPSWNQKKKKIDEFVYTYLRARKCSTVSFDRLVPRLLILIIVIFDFCILRLLSILLKFFSPMCISYNSKGFVHDRVVEISSTNDWSEFR